MSDTSQPFIVTKLHFATQADQQAFDCSGLKTGALAFVASGIADMDAPLNTDRAFWVYLPLSISAPGATVRITANSQGGVLAGRWSRITLAPNIAP